MTPDLVKVECYCYISSDLEERWRDLRIHLLEYERHAEVKSGSELLEAAVKREVKRLEKIIERLEERAE